MSSGLTSDAATQAFDALFRESRTIVLRLQNSDTYRRFEDAFQVTTGLPLALRALGADDSPLLAAKNANAFCGLLAASASGCSACRQLQQAVEQRSQGETQTLECHAGLFESLVPIRLGARIVAYLQTGQVRLGPPSRTAFLRLRREMETWGLAASPAEIERAYLGTRVTTPALYASALRLLGVFAGYISTEINQFTLSAPTEIPTIAKARAYIAEHYREEISLGDVARAVHLSTFYLCKTFHKATGVTFVDYLARLRTAQARMLLLDPHKRISEAAFEAGFQSLSQFNRTFLRVTGESPTCYREHVTRLPGNRASAPTGLALAV